MSYLRLRNESRSVTAQIYISSFAIAWVNKAWYIFAMPIIFRWIFSACLMRTFTTLTALLAVFVIIETFDKTRYLSETFSVGLLIEYLALKIPFMVAEFMPVVVLVATSVYLVELSRHQEIVALRAAGLGINKLVSPILSVAMLAALITFGISQWVAPITNHRMNDLERVHIKHQLADKNSIQWLKDGHTFFKLTPLSKHQYAVVVLQTDAEGHWLKKIDSSKAFYKDGQWVLHQVYISSPSANGLNLSHQDYLTLASRVSPQTARPPEPDAMDFGALNHYIDSLRQAGLKAESYIYSLHKKITAPLACLFMALLAIGLCTHISNRNSSASWGVISAISLGLLFYVFGNASALLASTSQLPPAYAAWLPSLTFGGFSVFLLLQREGI